MKHLESHSVVSENEEPNAARLLKIALVCLSIQKDNCLDNSRGYNKANLDLEIQEKIILITKNLMKFKTEFLERIVSELVLFNHIDLIKKDP